MKWWVAALLVAVGLGEVGCTAPRWKGQDPSDYSPAFFRELARVCSSNAATCHSSVVALQNGTAGIGSAIRFEQSNEKAWRAISEMFVKTKED